MRILHFHQDYPDCFSYPSTKVVSNLIESCEKRNPNIEHFVVSINRTSNPFKVSLKNFERGIAVVYWAIPLPLIYLPVMTIWALVVRLRLRNEKFDLVHGHKLTTEGLFTYFFAQLSKLPYCISVRGGTDVHMLRKMWDLRWLWKKVYNEAKHVFWVSCWAKGKVESYLKIARNENSSRFPNIGVINTASEYTAPKDRERFITVLSFHQMKRKGLLELLSALKLLSEAGHTFHLDVVGGGDERNLNYAKSQLKNMGLQDQVTIFGILSHDKVLKKISESKAMLLPAKNETFGLVYIEALANATPIMYLKNTGIDGYFEPADVGVRLPAQNIESIKQGILKLDKNHALLSRKLKENVVKGFLEEFYEFNIIAHYISTIKKFVKIYK